MYVKETAISYVFYSLFLLSFVSPYSAVQEKVQDMRKLAQECKQGGEDAYVFFKLTFVTKLVCNTKVKDMRGMSYPYALLGLSSWILMSRQIENLILFVVV